MIQRLELRAAEDPIALAEKASPGFTYGGAFPDAAAFSSDFSLDLRRRWDFSQPIADRAQRASGVGTPPETSGATLLRRSQAHRHTPFFHSGVAS